MRPATAVHGQLWWDSSLGRLFIYYVDTTTDPQWLEAFIGEELVNLLKCGEVADFLEAVEDSGFHDSEIDRRERQTQYKLDARKGKAENFDWLPSLPAKSRH